MGQIKQGLEEKESTPEYVHQGFGSFMLRIAAIFSEEASAIVKTYDAGTAIMEMFSSWFALVSKYVAKAYTTVKDAVKRSSLTIYHAVEAAVSALQHSFKDTMAFISMLTKAGISIASDCISGILSATKGYADGIASRFNKMFKREGDEGEEVDDEPIVHQGFGAEAMTPLITTVILGFLGAAAKLNIVPSASPANFYKTISALSSIEKFDLSKLTSFANLIFYAITGRDISVEYEIEREFNDSTAKLIQCLTELDNSINPTAELQMRITSEFLRMEKSYPALLADGKRSQARTTLYKHLEAKVRPWVAGVKNGAPRLKPVVIVLSGTSGTGKTSAQKGLIAHVPQQLATIFEGKEREDVSIYAAHARMSTSYSVPCLGQKNEFDDGYRDPLFYCLEEYQTTKIDALKTEWFNHFMKCIDDQPYPLNMAFDKGNRYFNSPFVIATGNFKNGTHHTPVEDPEAYHRRLEFDLIVTRSNHAGPFDPYAHSVFTPSPTMIKTYKGDKPPSMFLRDYFAAKGFGPFDYDTLLTLVVGTYLDRLVTYHVTASPAPKSHLAEILEEFVEKADEIPDGFRVYTKNLIRDIPASPADRSSKYSKVKAKATATWKKTYSCLMDAFEVFRGPNSDKDGKKRDKSQKETKPPGAEVKDSRTQFARTHEVVTTALKAEPPKVVEDRVEEVPSMTESLLKEADPEVKIEDDPSEEFEHQGKADLQVYKVPTPPDAPGTMMMQHERLEDMLELFRAFLAVPVNPVYKGSICFSRPTEIMQYLEYKTLDPYVAIINWDPTLDEQCYPRNPWIHLHLFDKFCLQARGYVKSQRLETVPRQSLTKSQWSSTKKYFSQLYFHWYMAIESCMRIMDLKGDRNSCDRYVVYWKAAKAFLTPKEFSDLRRSVRLTFGKDLSNDCRLVNLPPAYVNKYKNRVQANLKRAARKRWDIEEARRLEKQALEAEQALLDEDEELEKNENSNRPAPIPRKPRGYKTYTEVQREQRVVQRRGALSKKGARLEKISHQGKTFSPSLTQTAFMANWTPMEDQFLRLNQQDVLKGILAPTLNNGWTSYFMGPSWAKQKEEFHLVRERGGSELNYAATILYHYFQCRRGVNRSPVLGLTALKDKGMPYVGLFTLASYFFTDDGVIYQSVPRRYASEAKNISPSTLLTFAKRELLTSHPDKPTADPDRYDDARALVAIARGRHMVDVMEGLLELHPKMHPVLAAVVALRGEEIMGVVKDASPEVMDGLVFAARQHVKMESDEYSATEALMQHLLGKEYTHRSYAADHQVAELVGIVFDIALTAACLYFLSPLFLQMFSMAKKFVSYISPAEITDMETMLAVEDALPVLHQISVRPNTPPIERPDASAALMSMLKGDHLTHQVGSGDAMIEAVITNVYKVRQTGIDVATAFFLHSSVAVFNSHVWDAMPQTFQLVPYVKMTEVPAYTVSKSFCTILEVDKARDRCIVSIPNIRAHRDITRHLASRAEIARLPAMGNGLMCCLNAAGRTDIQLVEEMRHFKAPLVLTKEYTLPEFASYKWPGARPGACGSLLCAPIDGRLKIVGYHDAGKVNAKVGVATYLPVEEVQPFHSSSLKQHPAFAALDATSTISLEPEGEVYKLQVNIAEEEAKFECKYSTYATGPSLFRPTDFATLRFNGGAPKIPADLSREAYNKALIKETRNDVVNVPEVVPALIKEYAEDILDTFYGGQRLKPCRTLTPEEALFGYGDLNNFDKDTAKGIRLKDWDLSKKKVLEGGEESEKFLEKFKDSQEAMKVGKFEYQLNCDKLKDEPRDPERVALKKTRVFKVTDFVDNVHMKCAVGDLVNQTHNFHWLTPSSCGIDPTAGEWRLLANHFDGHDVIESDISGFETVVTWLLYYLVNPLFRRVFTGWSLRYAAYVIVATINALRFESGRGRFLGWQNTSGNWLTTWINTLANMGFFSTVLIANALMRDLDPRKVLALLKIKLYSDDNLTALPYPWWNAQLLSESFKKMFNIELTGNDKGLINEAKKIWQCSFLSRGFRKENGQVYAPLAMDSLFSQLYYVRIPKKNLGDSRFMYQQLQQNLDNVFRELMEYPLQEAEKYKAQIVEFIVSNNIPLSILNIEIDRTVLKLLRQ